MLAALFVLQQLVAPLQGVVAFRATTRIDGWVRAQAMVAAGRPAGIGLLEDQEVQDRMAVAAGKPLPFRAATSGGAAVGVVSMVARYVQGVGAGLLVARFSVVLAIALAAGSLWFRRLNHRVNVAQARAFEDHMPSYRWAGYYTGLAVEPSAAKETRVFGLADWLVGRHREAWDRVTTSMSAVRHRTARRLTACYVGVFPLHALVFVSVGLAAADRRIGLGTLAMVIQAARKLVDLTQLGNDDYQIDFGAASLPAAAELQRRSREAVVAAPSGRRAANGLPRHEIRFESVSFGYPGASVPVFEGLDLVVAAGTSMALVGANGAGKTTLVKLLGRLYEPTSGRILVDGVDLRELDVAAWRDRLAVIFQDFVHYELSAADNVGLGGLSRIGDRPALVAAAARAGTLELIEGLAHGWARCCPGPTRAGPTCRAASGNGWRWLGHSWPSTPAPAYSPSTSPRPTWMCEQRPTCSTVSSTSLGARMAAAGLPPCSSPIASPPSAGPRASACSTRVGWPWGQASDLAIRLPLGLDSQLGRQFPEGTELSEGQWQKVAVARAMMGAAPLLLVLDEPTSGLDATAEHNLFERYADAATGAAAAVGAVTVLVSHRFSTVRLADTIVVVDQGRVVEQGSHDDLMARRGLYAELYSLQARAYR